MTTRVAPHNAGKVGAAQLSVVSNTTLTLLKLLVGLMTGSVSVLSEAAHSANDLVASVIALVSVRISDRPADAGHPYGHGKVESLSGMAEAALIFGAAAWIVYEAVTKLLHGAEQFSTGPGMAIMALSVVVNVLVSRRLFAVAKRTDSMALQADAEHLRTDVLTSVGVLAGLVLVRWTGWSVLDPIAAILVALLIVSAAWRLFAGAVAPLLDSGLPTAETDIVRGVLEGDATVRGFHKLRTRKSGSARHIDCHVMMDDNLNLVEAHRAVEELEDRIRALLPGTEVVLHVEPFEAEMEHQRQHHGGGAQD